MRIRATAAALAFALSAGAACAGALRVSPVGFELVQGRRATSLTVRNDGATTMTVQVRAFRWAQRDGGDVLEPTDDLVASPPFAELAPASDQTIRIVRPQPAPAGTQEESFRLLIDELPSPGEAEDHVVRLLMRHSVPVFLEAGSPGRPDVAWRAEPAGEGLVLTAVNRGDRRLRVANLRLLDAAGRTLARQDGLVGYVLSHSTIRWTLVRARDAQPGGPPARIRAETDQGAVDAPVASPQ